MHYTKHMMVGLLMLVGTQAVCGQSTEHEINNLGKINRAEHRISGSNGIGVLLGGYAGMACAFLTMEHFRTQWKESFDLWCKLAALTPEGQSLPKIPKDNVFAFASFVSCAMIVPMLIGVLVEQQKDVFYNKVKGNDVYAAAAANDVDAMACYFDRTTKDSKGRTPLMYAAAAGATEATQWLLHAMPGTINTAGWFETAHDVVAVDMQDIFGRTAAHYAAINGHKEILKKLVEDYAASIIIPDNNGVTVAILIEKNPELQITCMTGKA